MRHPCLVLIFIVIGLFACKKIKTERPPCLEEAVIIPIDTSYLSTPLVIPTHLIEEKLNQVVGQVLREDPDFEHINADGEKEGVKMKITRLPPLLKHLSLPDTAFLYVRSEIPFTQINAAIQAHLTGRTFEVSGRKINIRTAQIWGCGANLMLQLHVTGFKLKPGIFGPKKLRYNPMLSQP